MKRKSCSVEQIVAAVKQHELGTPAAEIARKLGIAPVNPPPAAPRLRLLSGQQGGADADHSGVPRPPKHPQHAALYAALRPRVPRAAGLGYPAEKRRQKKKGVGYADQG